MPEISFEPLGIGDLLRRSRHAVPPNQRSYAWEERNVRELLQDLNGEMKRPSATGPAEYFLGTIVLVDGKTGSSPQISDGQQRLATTSIILARIRDILRELGDKSRADAIQTEYLAKIDFVSGDLQTHIGLNVEDNAFYNDVILKAYPHTVSDTFLRASNKRLLTASKTAYDYLHSRIYGYSDRLRAPHLREWVSFIKERTHVVAVTVPDQNQAFRIFETLNDRGVRASQVDLLKNFFLEIAGERQAETHALWTELTGKLEAHFADEDDQMITYIRHLWITKNGHTVEKDLASKIRAKINTSTLAASFVADANAASVDYIALTEPAHPKWNPYKSVTREYLNTIIRYLKVEQIRPLLFAIAMHFEPHEVTKAFRYAVSISVRFLIFGGRGGFLDEHYAAKAYDIGTGKIKKARELREAMGGIVPTDRQFEDAFATARVSKGYLARYYLRAIDKVMDGDPDPEFIANDDYDVTNLEHIVPLRPGPEWHLTPDEAGSVQSLLGNMTLLRAKKNITIGNALFKEKVKEYQESGYSITNSIEKYGETFGIEQIKERQAGMAKLAIRAWPLTFE